MLAHSRRRFLGEAGTALLGAARAFPQTSARQGLDFPLVDYHVHLSPGFSLEDAVRLSQEHGVKFGIAQHAGTKENQYSGILTNDEELAQWMAALDGRPVYKGIQAEWLDWPTCFTKEAAAQLDYALSDAMTIPDRNGRRVKMWQAGFDPGNSEDFMERYVKWNVEVIEKEPLDIFSHPTWLPTPLDKSYDMLWTPERMKPIISALKRTDTAVEIDSAYNIPGMPFLAMAKDAGLKFSFGSNSGARGVRGIDFCIERARALGLTKNDIFTPAPRGRKPIERRKGRA